MVTIPDQLRIERVGPREYKAFLHDELCYRKVAHGGVLISLIQLALEQSFKHDYKRARQPHLLDLHSSMIRPSTAGEVSIKITESKLGPMTSTMLFNLSQKSKVTVTGFATHTNFSALHPVLLSFPYKNPSALNPAPPQLPDFALLESNSEPNWTRVSYPFDPDIIMPMIPRTNFYFSTPSFSTTYATSSTPTSSLGPTVAEFWVSFAEADHKFYTSTLGWLADMAPRIFENIREGYPEPSTFTKLAMMERGIKQRQGKTELPLLRFDPVGYPTLSLTLEIKRPLPEEGVRFLYIRAAMQWYEGGKWDMEVVMYDQEMNHVAVSRLISLALDLRVVEKLTKQNAAAMARKGKKRTEKL